MNRKPSLPQKSNFRSDALSFIFNKVVVQKLPFVCQSPSRLEVPGPTERQWNSTAAIIDIPKPASDERYNRLLATFHHY